MDWFVVAQYKDQWRDVEHDNEPWDSIKFCTLLE
jgi:hypothetical protein